MASKASRPKKAWPTDGSPAKLEEDIVLPLRRAFEQAYTLQRINENKSIRWNGLPSPNENINFNDILAVEAIAEAEENDSDALEVLLNIAVELGIEQGRRMERQSLKPSVKLFERGVNTLEEKAGLLATLARKRLQKVYTEVMTKGKK